MDEETTNTTAREVGSFKTATINGTSLAYREEGQGEPVVFVHGGVSDLRTWENQLHEIGHFYRAITYSRRYHRPNRPLEPGMSDPWEPHADDLASFLHEVGASPAHLVGNSQGAYINLVAALRTPEVVRSLVIEEPPVLPLFVSTPPRPLELLRLFVTRPRTALAIVQFGTGAMAPLGRLYREGKREEALRVFLRGVLGEIFSERISEARQAQARENLDPLGAFVSEGESFPALPESALRALGKPCLLLTGAHSPPFLLRLTDRLEELLPNVERKEIPNASHLMHEDNPPAVNQTILEFIGRHRDRHTG